ncbi:hypothetical protein ACVWZK_002934 [Bradyrhizobium sp. GM0.4]
MQKQTITMDMKQFQGVSIDPEEISVGANLRLRTIRRETGLMDGEILDALLTKSIDDASPSTLRKLFPEQFASCPEPTATEKGIEVGYALNKMLNDVHNFFAGIGKVAKGEA